MEIRPVGAELFHTDELADMTKRGTFRNFANPPKKLTSLCLFKAPHHEDVAGTEGKGHY
jgi:hypothetical protein